MHVGHININNVKMSKSLNNFIYAKDLISDYGSNVIRWYFLQAHYASPMNFSKDLMEQNRNEFNKFIKLINNALVQLLLFQVDYKFEQVEVSREFKNYMEDNLDFANVVSLL
jgi:cysteinyl-tRNA synthetase